MIQRARDGAGVPPPGERLDDASGDTRGGHESAFIPQLRGDDEYRPPRRISAVDRVSASASPTGPHARVLGLAPSSLIHALPNLRVVRSPRPGLCQANGASLSPASARSGGLLFRLLARRVDMGCNFAFLRPPQSDLGHSRLIWRRLSNLSIRHGSACGWGALSGCADGACRHPVCVFRNEASA